MEVAGRVREHGQDIHVLGTGILRRPTAFRGLPYGAPFLVEIGKVKLVVSVSLRVRCYCARGTNRKSTMPAEASGPKAWMASGN